MAPEDRFLLHLQKIRLRNFRVFPSLDLDLGARLVFITGNNGLGKTSILEAAGLMSSLRSFRNAGDRDLIRWQDRHYHVRLEYENTNGKQVLSAGFGKEGAAYRRKLSFNGRQLQSVNDFIGKFQTVVFSPNDIRILDTEMSERRKYIDMVLSTLSPAYLAALQRYRKLLEMRSKVLKKYGAGQAEYLDSLDVETAQTGSLIQSERSGFLTQFQEFFDSALEKISGANEAWTLEYEASIPGGEEKSVYSQGLKKAREGDVKMRHSTKGVHRDRIYFRPKLTKTAAKPQKPQAESETIDTKTNRARLEIKEIGSQGQKRSAALALKMAQFEYTGKRTHETPVLLIDDVLNELDIGRRKRFIEFLGNIGQAIVTATDLEGIGEFIEKQKSVSGVLTYEVKKDEEGNSVVSPVRIA